MNLNQVAWAFGVTLEAARPHMANCSSDNEHADWPHLEQMRQDVFNWAYLERHQSIETITKANRYLGWAQACVYIGSMGEISLEDLRQINREANQQVP